MENLSNKISWLKNWLKNWLENWLFQIKLGGDKEVESVIGREKVQSWNIAPRIIQLRKYTNLGFIFTTTTFKCIISQIGDSD